MARTHMTVARVKPYSAAKIGKAERHNERKNQSYENLNVDMERIPMNVVFKSTDGLTYNEYFKKQVEEGRISTRGLKEDAALFNEMVIDVNTEYFEEHGGYEYAKRFYEEAYRFCCELYDGEQNIVSAVMHADEINKAVSEKLGKSVYHYHLHVVAIPTVVKEVKWSKRCKDPELVGKTKEIIHQVSHWKKWKNTVQMRDEKGDPVLNENGKPVFIKSYSLLQDDLFGHMRDAGFADFVRGKHGSTRENLSSLDYQIEQDKKRLAQIQSQVTETQEKLEQVTLRYQENRQDNMTYREIEDSGKRTIGGYLVSKKDYQALVRYSEEAIAGRGKLRDLERKVKMQDETIFGLKYDNRDLRRDLRELQNKYNELMQRCKPYLDAIREFPEKVKEFFEALFPPKQKAAEKEQQEPIRQQRVRKRSSDYER